MENLWRSSMEKRAVEFKALREEHIDPIVEIEKVSFAAPWSRESFFQELYHNEKAIYLVALHGEKVIGYGGFWKILDEGHITNIAIHPDFRGQGIGSKLIDTLITTAKNRGIQSITLEVRKSNQIAQNLYIKHGFISVGTRKNYYEDNREDAVIMWKYDLK